MRQFIVATIDLGSNSFHLAITMVKGPGKTKIIARRKQKVQLRAGLDEKGYLTMECQKRAWLCLKNFSEVMRQCRVTHVKAVGTYTIRTAKNRLAFIHEAERILKHSIDIISGREEARLIYVGASQKTPIEQKNLIIDIGGGSTELIIGQHHKIKVLHSLEMGCVSYQQSFFPNGQLTEAHFKEATSQAKKTLSPVKEHLLTAGFEVCLGASGTLKAICGILRQARRQNYIDLESLQTLQKKLIRFGHIDKIKLDGLRADRESILAGGLSVLIAIFEVLKIKEMRLSYGGVREGMLVELISELYNHN